MTASLGFDASGGDSVRTGSRWWFGKPVGIDRTLVSRVIPAVLVVSGALLLVPFRDVRPTVVVPLATGQLAPSLAVLDLMVGLLLMLAGVGAWLSGLAWRIGIVSALAGLAWFGPDLFAVRDVDPWLRILGQFVLSPLRWPILLHLGVAHLGLDRRRDVRAWLLVLYGATATMVFASVALYEPFWDPWCTDCQWDNPLVPGTGAMAAGRGAAALLRIGWVVLAIAGAMAAAGFVIRGRTLSDLRPRPRATTLAAMSLIGTAAAVRAWSLVVAPIQDPREQVWLLDWWTLATGASLLAGTVVAAAIATWQRRERMGRLADSLVAAPKPGALARELALALGDPELTIAYVTSEGRLVDPDGEVITTGDVDRVATPIEREGTVLAHVHHSPATDRAALAAAFGPTLLVALDNERLRATQLARLSELRRSRARIVAVADAARRGLERDLHDGVQQQLIALVFDLRSLRLAFERSRDPRRVDGVAALEARAQTAIDELRRIAHGIHPAILSRSGLEEALLSLAEESPAPVKVRAGGLGRLPDAIESAAYAVAAEVVRDAARRGAGQLVITARRVGGCFRLTTRDDGLAAASPPRPVIDRVEAVGGTITADTSSKARLALRVDLPCE